MVDAAVLLEAGWTDMVHEVWVTVIPDEEVKCFFLLVKDVPAETAFTRHLKQAKLKPALTKTFGCGCHC